MTCQKARKWLKDKDYEFEEYDIMTYDLSESELNEWLQKSNLEVSGFYGKSGVRYKELGLKDRLPTLSEEEKKQLLVGDNKLLKRPIVVTETAVVVGFKEEEWKARL